jgi:DinB superfamily
MAAVANPYAGDLGNLDARKIVAETAHELIRLEEQLGADGLDRSIAPGKWTARMILCHLVDCEIAFGFRLRQALAEPHHVIQPFDQDAWSARYHDPSLSGRTALQVFAALRGWNVVLVNSLPPEAFSKPLSHPERGEMTLQTIVETMAGHDLHHLRQLQAIASPTAAA